MRIDSSFLKKVLTELVRIDSTNPSLSAHGAGESEIAAYVADVLTALGLAVDVHELAPGRVNVVGRLPGRGGGRSLMLNAHTDPVGMEGMAAPFSAAIKEGKLYGRGAQDMKASLAACITAVKALQDAEISLAGDVLIAAVADEEYRSIGTAAVVQRHPVDGAIVTEPTDLELCVAHKGFVWLEVEVLGKAAHGSRFADGIDANMRMGRFLAQLDQLEQALRRRAPHPLVGPPSLHAATLRGGSEWSAYAARSTLQIERRTIPGESAAQVAAEIQTILDRLHRADPSFNATQKTLLVRDAFEGRKDASITQTVESAATQVRGRRPKTVGHAGWMDSSLLDSAGVETVIIGPTGGGLHTEEEWVELESVYDLARILAIAAEQYCMVNTAFRAR